MNLLGSYRYSLYGLVASLFVLYYPTYISLINGAWSYENQSHGPIILIIILYILWQDRYEIVNSILYQERKSYKFNLSSLTGVLLIILGLMIYVVGRSQNITILDVGSQIPLLSGLVLTLFGFQVFKLVFFPIAFILFVIPIPGYILDPITLPMKLAVSAVTDNILYLFNYPIARNGVVLQIGQYQLLVADACAGVQTLISLEALGMLYLKLTKSSSAFRNILLAILIVPISFTANVIRVITLTLITFYFGNEVGQGFIHGFAGMFLFLVALILIMTIDTFIIRLITWKHTSNND